MTFFLLVVIIVVREPTEEKRALTSVLFEGPKGVALSQILGREFHKAVPL